MSTNFDDLYPQEQPPEALPPVSFDDLYPPDGTRPITPTRMDRSSYMHAIVQAANRNGVPPEIALAVAHWESGYNQGATSKAGAIGIMQLMPATARGLGVDPNDPDQNIEGGVRYLAQLHRQFGDWSRTLMAYNAGATAARTGRLPPETQRYVPGVLALSRLIRNVPQYAREFPQFGRDLIGALGRVGPQAALSGATLGFVRPPVTRTAAERTAGAIGQAAGSVVPFGASLLVPGVGALPGALRTGAAFGLMGAGRAGIEVARGEVAPSEIPIEAGREALTGVALDVFGRVLGRAWRGLIANIAKSRRVSPAQVAQEAAQAAAQHAAETGKTPEEAVRWVMQRPYDEWQRAAPRTPEERVPAPTLAPGPPSPAGGLITPLERAPGPVTDAGRAIQEQARRETELAARAAAMPRAGGGALLGAQPPTSPSQVLLPGRPEIPGAPARAGVPPLAPQAEPVAPPAPAPAIAAGLEGLPLGSVPLPTAPDYEAWVQQHPSIQPAAAPFPPPPPEPPVAPPALPEPLAAPSAPTPPAAAPTGSVFTRMHDVLGRNNVQIGTRFYMEATSETGQTVRVGADTGMARAQQTAQDMADTLQRTVVLKQGNPNGSVGRTIAMKSPGAPGAAAEPAVSARRRTPVQEDVTPEYVGRLVNKVEARFPSPSLRTAILERVSGALIANGGNAEAVLGSWGEQTIQFGPRNRIVLDALAARPAVEYQAARLAGSAAAQRLTPELLAKQASTEMVPVIATQIRRVSELARTESERAGDLAEQRRAEGAQLGPPGRRGRVEKELLAREHDVYSGMAAQYVQEAEARIAALEQSGLPLPPLPDVPTPQQMFAGVRSRDPGAVETMQRTIDRAKQGLGDAHRAIQDATGGDDINPQDATGAARRYLDELDTKTRAVAEFERLLERAPPIEGGSGPPADVVNTVKRALGTDRVGLLAGGIDELVTLIERSGIGAAANAIRFLVRGTITPMQSIIRRVPSGQAFLQALDGTERVLAQNVGQHAASYTDFLRLTRRERWNIRAAAEGREAPLNQKVVRALAYWRAYFGRKGEELERQQFKTFDPRTMEQFQELRLREQAGERVAWPDEGPWRDFHPRQQYWPHSTRREILAGRNPDRVRSILRESYLRRGLSEDEAAARTEFDMASIRRMRGVRYGNIEMARTVDLPDQLREEPEIELARYMLQAERATAIGRYFGTHFPVAYRGTGEPRLTWTGAENLFEQIAREEGQQGYDNREARQLAEYSFRVFAGEGALDDFTQQWKRAASAVNRLAVIANMSLSSIWKITQPFTNAPIRTSWTSFAQGLFDVLAHPRDGFRFASEAGALMNDVFQDVLSESEYAQPLDRWSRKFLTFNGFIPAVRWSRAVAAATGRRWTKGLFDRLVANPQDRFAKAELEGILGAPALRSALGRGQLAVQDYYDAGFTIARDVEFLGRADRYPAFWASPWGQLAAMFHRFTYQQSQFIIREIKKRPLHTLAWMVPGWFVIGDASQELMSKLRGKERPFVLGELYDWLVLGHPPQVSTQQLLRSFVESTVGWAVMGFWGDVWRSMGTSQMRALELATGPVVSDVLQTGYHGVSAISQETQVRLQQRPDVRRTALLAFMRDIVRHVPFLGPRLVEQFRTPHERYTLMRQAAIAAWDGGDTSTFLDLEQQLMDVGRPITFSDIQRHERVALEQQAGVQRPMPGEPGYAGVVR